jgi:NSS family neurotransmitter:Na+ symporter
MLPISGLLIALFVGYVVDKKIVTAEMKGMHPKIQVLWQFTLRYLAPFSIGAVFIMGLYDKLI